ncbi:MAG: hypothetical protein ACREQY_09410, partial [Candidatus Binatia bacterium]
MTKLSIWMLVLAAGIAGGTAWSQEAATAPEEETYQGIPYRSGGIGRDERDALERAAKDYNL